MIDQPRASYCQLNDGRFLIMKFIPASPGDASSASRPAHYEGIMFTCDEDEARACVVAAASWRPSNPVGSDLRRDLLDEVVTGTVRERRRTQRPDVSAA